MQKQKQRKGKAKAICDRCRVSLDGRTGAPASSAEQPAALAGATSSVEPSASSAEQPAALAGAASSAEQPAVAGCTAEQDKAKRSIAEHSLD